MRENLTLVASKLHAKPCARVMRQPDKRLRMLVGDSPRSTNVLGTDTKRTQITCYREVMLIAKSLLLVCLLPPLFPSGQAPSDESVSRQPSLPVIDYNACPFEGCMFRKWVVAHDSDTFSSWKEDRKLMSKVKKGEVVIGLTGVHITYEPDRIQVLKPIPELDAQPGDIILRYMYHGEGFADIWFKGQRKKEYDCSFITEQDGSGCSHGCAAKVISVGRKDWWVRFKTVAGSIGWAKVEDQFDCIDKLGGDAKCDDVNNSPPLV